jgi:hypothetical protein
MAYNLETDPEYQAARRAGLIPGLAGDPVDTTLEPQPGLLPVNPGQASPMDRYDTIPPPVPAPPVQTAPVTEPQTDPTAGLRAAMAVGPDIKSTRIVPTAKFGEIREDMNKLDTKRGQNIDEQTKHNVGVAGEVYKDEQQNQKDQQALQTQLATERAQVESQKTAALAYEKKLREANAKDYEKSFFEERGTAKSIGIALSVGLGALGQGLAAAGGVKIDNVAWDITQKLMDQHSAREKGRLLKQKEEIERAGGDVTRIDQQLRDFDMITRPHREASLLKNFE